MFNSNPDKPKNQMVTPAFVTPAKGSSVLQPKLNINLTPVTGPPMEAERITLESAQKRKAQESPDNSLARWRLRTGSPLQEGSLPLSPSCDIDKEDTSNEEDDITPTSGKNDSVSIENVIHEEVQQNQLFCSNGSNECSAGQHITMQMLQEAILMAIRPLKEEIKTLAEIIKLQNKTETNIAGSSERLQNTRLPGSPGAGRGWGLPGQGRPIAKKLQHMSWAGVASSNIPTLSAPPHRKPVPEPLNSAKSSNPAFGLARRCQGFHPITSKDIKKFDNEYADIEDDEARFQKAGKHCIRDFLRVEMGISKRVADDIRIKNVFFATAGIASAILYAQ